MKVTKEEVYDWCVELFHRSKFKTVQWNDGTHGLINVPQKYCTLIATMAAAMESIAIGNGLPKFKDK